MLEKLDEEGIFPLGSFVKVDPDEIRRNMPEFMHHAKFDPTTAGYHTRKEAGYIAEITTLAALQSGRSVIVDGSVRDYRWYKGHFSDLRSQFPGLRIAILQVSAPREAVLQRAATRAMATGRYVPLETLERSMQEVPATVTRLAPLADFYCEFENAPHSGIRINTAGVTWESFAQQWNQNVTRRA